MTPRLPSAALALVFPLIATAGFFDQRGGQQDAFLSANEAFQVDALALDASTIQARWTIAPGYYLYRHRLGIDVIEPATTSVQWQAPPGQDYEDEHFGAVEIYHDTLDVPIEVNANISAITLEFRYQGCAEAGLCYPPQTRTVTLDLNPE